MNRCLARLSLFIFCLRRQLWIIMITSSLDVILIKLTMFEKIFFRFGVANITNQINICNNENKLSQQRNCQWNVRLIRESDNNIAK